MLYNSVAIERWAEDAWKEEEMAYASTTGSDEDSVDSTTVSSIFDSRTRGWKVVIRLNGSRDEDQLNAEPIGELLSRVIDGSSVETMAGQLEKAGKFLHYQIYIKFRNTKKQHQVRALFKDWPNVGIIPEQGSWTAAIAYVTKEETRVTGTDPFIYASETGKSKKRSRHDIYASVLALSESVESAEGSKEARKQASDILREQAPIDFFYKQSSIETQLKSMFPTPFKHLYTLNEYIKSPLIFTPGKKGMIYVLHGPTNTGKTGFACAHFKNPAIISMSNDVDQINRFTDGLVIDDMLFRQYNASTLIHLCDSEYERHFNIKYSIAKIPPGMPKIFTCNSLEMWWPERMDEATKDAVRSRVIFVEVPKPLFKPSPIEALKAGAVIDSKRRKLNNAAYKTPPAWQQHANWCPPPHTGCTGSCRHSNSPQQLGAKAIQHSRDCNILNCEGECNN